MINFPQGLPDNVKEAQVPWEEVYAQIPHWVHKRITGNETKIDPSMYVLIDKKKGPEYLGSQLLTIERYPGSPDIKAVFVAR